MLVKGWCFKRCQEYEQWLVYFQKLKILLSEFDVRTHFLNDLNPILDRHLEVQ